MKPAQPEHPRHRSDLIILRRQIEDDVFYVVADPRTNEHLRFGEVEHTLLDLLDGTRDLEKVAADFKERTGSSIEPEDLAEFVEYLKDASLIESTSFDPAHILDEFRERERAGLARPQLISGSIAFLRFLPFNPDRFLGWLAARIPWFWSRSFFISSIALMIVATVFSVLWWDRLGPATVALFAESIGGGTGRLARTLIMVYVIGGLIVVIHECAHGLTLKHFGGKVPEMGFVLAYFQIPGAYTDTSASYLLPSRFRRVMVSLAGGYIEMVLASIAVFTWWASPTGSIVSQASLILLIIAGPLTLLFNWNPLVPFDGYYMITDIFEAPNLMGRSFGYIGDLIRTKIFGIEGRHPLPPVRLRPVFLVFGLLSWAYQALWIVLVPYVAFWIFSHLLGDVLGAVGAAAVIIKFGRYPLGVLVSFVRQVFEKRGGIAMIRKPKVSLTALAALVLATAAFLTPACPVYVHGEATLQAFNRAEVRAPAPGFVTRVTAEEGDKVEAEQMLAALRNDEMVSEMEILAMEQAKVRAEMLQAESRNERVEAARKRTALVKLGKEHAVLRSRMDLLGLKAPLAGTVIGEGLGDRLGTRLEEGDLWCEVARTDRLRASIKVPETDIRDVDRGAPAEAVSSGFPRRTFAGSVIEVPTRGAVPELKDERDKAAAAGAPQVALYDVQVVLDNGEDLLRPGMTVELRIAGERRSLAWRTYRIFKDIVRGKLWW